MCLTRELKTAPGLGTGDNSVLMHCSICCVMCKAVFGVLELAKFSPMGLNVRSMSWKKQILILTFLTPLVTFHCCLAKKWDSWYELRSQLTTWFGERKVLTKYILDRIVKPLEEFLEIQPFQLEIQTHKSWLPPECQFYGDNPISYFPARHFQTLRSGKCF